VAGITMTPATQSTNKDTSRPASLDFDDIVNGASAEAGVGKNYWQCGSPSGFSSGDPMSCQDVKQAPFKFQGIKNYLLNQFAGDQGTDVNGNPNMILNVIQPGSILDSYKQGNPLTAAQISLLQQTPINFQKMLVELQQHDGYTQIALYDQAFQIFAESLAASTAMGIVNVTRTSYSPTASSSSLTAKQVVPMANWQKENVDKLLTSAKKNLDIKGRMDRLNALQQAMMTAKSLRS
jgi:hypothetical protein